MQYRQTMIGTGALNGSPFTNATITFELDGDTANITTPSGTVHRLAGTGTVTISGVTFADLDSNYHVFTNTPVASDLPEESPVPTAIITTFWTRVSGTTTSCAFRPDYCQR